MIAIRSAVPEDAAAIAAIYAPHVLSGIVSFEVEPPDAAAIVGRMAAGGALYPWLVAEAEDGAVAGYAYAARFRDRPAYRFVVETSIYLADAAQGRGVGRQLYQTLIDTLRAQGFVHAIGALALPNQASVALHERLGFRPVGVYREVGFKHGQWIDVGVWQCELNEPQVPPVEPRPFGEVGVVRA